MRFPRIIFFVLLTLSLGLLTSAAPAEDTSIETRANSTTAVDAYAVVADLQASINSILLPHMPGFPPQRWPPPFFPDPDSLFLAFTAAITNATSYLAVAPPVSFPAGEDPLWIFFPPWWWFWFWWWPFVMTGPLLAQYKVDIILAQYFQTAAKAFPTTKAIELGPLGLDLTFKALGFARTGVAS